MILLYVNHIIPLPWIKPISEFPSLKSAKPFQGLQGLTCSILPLSLPSRRPGRTGLLVAGLHTLWGPLCLWLLQPGCPSPCSSNGLHHVLILVSTQHLFLRVLKPAHLKEQPLLSLFPALGESIYLLALVHLLIYWHYLMDLMFIFSLSVFPY